MANGTDCASRLISLCHAAPEIFRSPREYLPGLTTGVGQVAHGKLPEETDDNSVQPARETANPVMDAREERLFRSLLQGTAHGKH